MFDLIKEAEDLKAQGRWQEAVQRYHAAIAADTGAFKHIYWFNLGVLLSENNALADAENAYRSAIYIKPDFVHAWFNLGSAVERGGRKPQAAIIWQSMLDHPLVSRSKEVDMYLMVLSAQGRMHEEMREYEKAEAFLLESLLTQADQPKVIQHWVHLRQKQCKWPVYDVPQGIDIGELMKWSSPLSMLSASDDPGMQLAAAMRYVNEKVNMRLPVLKRSKPMNHHKIRIGFLSSDFCLHAVSLLTVELLELIDRSEFEVYGFCWSREDGTALRKRMLAAMDHYVPIGSMSDEQAALKIHDSEIDVLIDLQGITSGARPNILSYRPAPVQMTYLGFPGTTGHPCIDYVIADKYLIPAQYKPFYTEKPFYMPHVFQSSDRQRPMGKTPQRSDYGLPKDKFVYCTFNNNYKFTPTMFTAWMQILKKVPKSVLWLLEDNEWSKKELIKVAAQHGIKSDRLIFTGRVAPENYLARYVLADLFLDCYPFNGGTTVNDALWMRLPVLTLSGKVFASRMAGSLLTAMNMPELITEKLDDYVAKAVYYGSKPGVYAAMREKLGRQAEESPLFDMVGFVRGFEVQIKECLMVSTSQQAGIMLTPQRKSEPASLIVKPDICTHDEPYGMSNLNKIQDKGARRYVVVAPPFEHNSAGIRVMYDLQKWLVRAGLDAIVCTLFTGYPLEQFEDDIVIYPEVAPGNPLNAKRVIRFILNTPGKLGHGKKTFDPSEILIAYNKELAHYANGRMLQVPAIEPFFNAHGAVKSVDSVFVGKGQDLGLHPVGCIAITKSYPPSRVKVAQLLRSTKTLYMYDDFSMISHEATLCGCAVKLIRKDGVIIDYPHQSWPPIEDFKAQLNDLITMTKELWPT